MLVFGTAGVPHCAEKRSSEAGISAVRAMGLDAMELQFVQRVGMGAQTAGRVRAAAEEQGVLLSAHAPYYINLNSRDPAKLRASKERLLLAARVAAICGARNVVFHAAFNHNDPPAMVYEQVKAQLRAVVTQLREEHVGVCLRPETSGKPSQFGSLDEILQLSAEVEGICPCIDFGHLYARNAGAVNTYTGFEDVLTAVRDTLGASALQDMHMHVAGVAYGRAGERKHLAFNGSGLRYEELLRALVDWNVGGTVICESPILEQDALVLQRTYGRFAGYRSRKATE